MILLNDDVLRQITARAEASSLHAASHSFCVEGPKIRLCVYRPDLALLCSSVYSGLVWNGSVFQNTCIAVVSVVLLVVFENECSSDGIKLGFDIYLAFSLVWYVADCSLSYKCDCILQYAVVSGLSGLILLVGMAIHASYLLARRACAMRRLISHRGWTFI